MMIVARVAPTRTRSPWPSACKTTHALVVHAWCLPCMCPACMWYDMELKQVPGAGTVVDTVLPRPADMGAARGTTTRRRRSTPVARMPCCAHAAVLRAGRPAKVMC